VINKLKALIFLMSATSLVAYAQLRNAIGMEFVRIPPGEFMMGCSPGDSQCNGDETPRHRVQVTKGFEIGKYEVTQAQWVALMQTNPSANRGDNHPVETVSKIEAGDFINKLNERNDGYRYRLPTEAEWEYAARAGTDTPYSGPINEVAWYAGNSEDETHPVGLKKPNAWGLHDTQGNVREWVSDYYSPAFYNINPAIDPTGPQPCAPGAPGGPGGRGGPRGGRGPQPVPFPTGGTPQEQIDALRRQVEQLQQQLQQLRNDFESGPRGGRGLPGGPGGNVSGPFNCVPTGPRGDLQLVDALDGLPTGLPVVRGGGWDQKDSFQRVSARYSYYGPTLRVSDIGFRVVREAASR